MHIIHTIHENTHGEAEVRRTAALAASITASHYRSGDRLAAYPPRNLTRLQLISSDCSLDWLALQMNANFLAFELGCRYHE